MVEAADVHPWEDPAWLAEVREFGERLGLSPEHDALLCQALTHRSLVEESPHGDNERLEFLGDSVLALIVNEHFYRTLPEHAEGQLTRLKQRYVSQPSLAVAAQALGLGNLLAMARNEQAGRERPSVLSDAFEAVLAAVYLARGLEAARELVCRELIARIDPEEEWDYKSRLQELYQEKHRETPAYVTNLESGTPHDPIFSSKAKVGKKTLGEGRGRSKKQAEQAAAADALHRLENPQPKRRRTAKAAVPEAPVD